MSINAQLTLEDTTKFLWDYLYQVRIPQLALLTENELRIQGLPTTGDRSIDRELANQLIVVYIPVVTMVKYFIEGHVVRLVKSNEVKTIYDHLQRHLELWAGTMHGSLNSSNAPIDELRAMNRFASSLFEYARDHLDAPMEAPSSFMRHIDSFAFTRYKATVTPVDQMQHKAEAERPDFDKLFKTVNEGGLRKWN